jgi:hypothetical protein
MSSGGRIGEEAYQDSGMRTIYDAASGGEESINSQIPISKD